MKKYRKATYLKQLRLSLESKCTQLFFKGKNSAYVSKGLAEKLIKNSYLKIKV